MGSQASELESDSDSEVDFSGLTDCEDDTPEEASMYASCASLPYHL
jgi:hypothetical protein